MPRNVDHAKTGTDGILTDGIINDGIRVSEEVQALVDELDQLIVLAYRPTSSHLAQHSPGRLLFDMKRSSTGVSRPYRARQGYARLDPGNAHEGLTRWL